MFLLMQCLGMCLFSQPHCCTKSLSVFIFRSSHVGLFNSYYSLHVIHKYLFPTVVLEVCIMLPCPYMPSHNDAKYNVSFITYKDLVNLLQGKRMMNRRLYKASPFLEMFSRFANYKKPVLLVRLELLVHTLDQRLMVVLFLETSRAALVDTFQIPAICFWPFSTVIYLQRWSNIYHYMSVSRTVTCSRNL